MAVTNKYIFLLVFCLPFFAVWSTEINNDEFKLLLDEDWVKISDEDLRKYEAEVLVLSKGKDKTVYQYGFQLNNGGSFTSGPFILIKVQHLIKDKNIDVNRIAELEKTIRQVMDVGNANYEEIHKHYWLNYDDQYNKVEKFRVLLIQKLATFGKVSIFFHAKKTEFKQYEPIFKKISYSLSIKKENDIQLMTQNQLSKIAEQNHTNDIVTTIILIVVHVLAICLLGVIYTSKKKKQKENSTELKSNEKSLIPVEPQKIILEKNTEEIVDYNRQGVFTSEEESNLINEELQIVLLIAIHRISKIGGRVTLLAIIMGVCLSVILYAGFLDELIGLNLNKLHVWGVYIIIPFITLFLSFEIKKPFQKSAYLKEREKIQTISKKSGFSKYKLITTLEKHIEFNIISLHLKLDVESKWK